MLPGEHKSRESLNDSELCHSRSGMGLGNCEAILTLAVPHFREVWDSPTARLRQEGSSQTGWGAEEKGRAQKCTSLSYGLDNNQMKAANDLCLPSLQEGCMRQFGLHQSDLRLRIKDHNLSHNHSVTTKNQLFLRQPTSASESTVFSKSISSSEIMFLNLPRRPPVQNLEDS